MLEHVGKLIIELQVPLLRLCILLLLMGHLYHADEIRSLERKITDLEDKRFLEHQRNTTEEELYVKELDRMTQENSKQLLAYQNLQKQLQFSNKKLEKLKSTQAQNIAALNLTNNVLEAENAFWKSPKKLNGINETVEKFLNEPLAFRELKKRGNNDVDNLLQVGVEKYKDKDYKNAIADFEQLLQLKPEDDEALFYKGMCYKYASPDYYPGAISIFEQLLNQENSHSKEDVLQWQLALLYAKTKRYQKAKDKLEEIVGMVAPGHKRKADAEELLAYF